MLIRKFESGSVLYCVKEYEYVQKHWRVATGVGREEVSGAGCLNHTRHGIPVQSIYHYPWY